MLDSLVNIINTLKERIRAHRGELEENETRTRMALIDPLLTVLGWDTSDPGYVKPEYPVTGGKADYGLRNAGPTPAAFIEAKKLGEPLESHREQMTRYSNMAGVKYAGLTNGDRWELYEVFSPTSLDERRILDLSILNDPPHQSALKLLLLWRPNLESGAPIPANESVLGQGGAPPLPPPLDEQIISLRREGLSFRAIGAKVGMRHSAVRNALIRLGEHTNTAASEELDEALAYAQDLAIARFSGETIEIPAPTAVLRAQFRERFAPYPMPVNPEQLFAADGTFDKAAANELLWQVKEQAQAAAPGNSKDKVQAGNKAVEEWKATAREYADALRAERAAREAAERRRPQG